MSTTLLRNLGGSKQAPASLANATLILVDYQNTYTQGVMELEGWQAALEAGSQLLTAARTAGAKVIHVIHDGGSGSPYDITTHLGDIHNLVTPVNNEPVVHKKFPDGFHDTELSKHVDEAGNNQVIIIGFMTHMCVTFTSEGASLRGNEVTVVANACATRAINTATMTVTASNLHNCALATINDRFGVVVPSMSSLVK